jgi:phosphonatase-like hydrolase
MIELVVFDMAGTTVHDGNAVSDCFRAALSAVAVVPSLDAVNNVMGLHKPEAIRRLLAAAGRQPNDRDIDAIHADFVERMLRYYASDPSVREIPGAGAVFAELRRAGVNVALNSGFSRQIVDAILQRLAWTDAIDASIASDEAPRGRPHPDMIRILMAKLGITDTQHVAKVGDTPVDLEEGVNAGCGLVLGVTTGSFTRSQLEACALGSVIDAVTGVPERLRQSAD